MKKDWNMCSVIRPLFVGLLFFCSSLLFSQGKERRINFKTLEIGGAIAGAEAFYYGIYSKLCFPLSQKKHHFIAGFSFTGYFDFKGESTSLAYLENDIDMRLIPAVYFGYNFNFTKVDIAVEIPLGTSIAITKGILVNENIGFKKEYSNTELLWHYGIGLSAKYKINDRNKIGIFGFLPLVKDLAWSSPLIGLGWTIYL